MRSFILIGLAAAAAVYGQDITGVGNFSHIVTNLDKSLEFYRDVLGLELAAPARPFDGNPAIMKLGDTAGAQSRFVQLRVPGSAIGVEIIEYKDIDRKPAHPRFQDPGAANLTLRVRDLGAVVARAKKAGVHVLTAGGVPAAVRGGMYIFLQDDDGFVVELSQQPQAPAELVYPTNPPRDTSGKALSDVLGGGFETTVGDAEKTVTAYRALGLEPVAPAAFNNDKVMTDTAGTPGAQFRQSRAAIPGGAAGGTMASITFIEFKDIDRKPLHTRVQDPGTAILQLNVRDLGTLLPKLKAAGFTVVSSGGQPVDLGGARIALVRDLNNLFLELIERRAQ
jgi:catechol 2,3-dioxygenase-like lactoylglutathione lyase family enzyme